MTGADGVDSLGLDEAGALSAPDDLPRALQRLAEADLLNAEAAQHRLRIEAFCAAHADALHRSCLSGHLTGSAFVVDPTRPRSDGTPGGQALLIHHRKLGRWLQPGGHADGEGDLALVALTEAYEETGISGLRVVLPALDADVHEIPQRGDVPAHVHLDVRFLVICPPGAEAAPDEAETMGAAWHDLDSDVLLAEPALARMAIQAERFTS